MKDDILILMSYMLNGIIYQIAYKTDGELVNFLVANANGIVYNYYRDADKAGITKII